MRNSFICNSYSWSLHVSTTYMTIIIPKTINEPQPTTKEKRNTNDANMKMTINRQLLRSNDGNCQAGTSKTVNVGQDRRFVNVIVYSCMQVMTIAIDKMIIVLIDCIEGNGLPFVYSYAVIFSAPFITSIAKSILEIKSMARTVDTRIDAVDHMPKINFCEYIFRIRALFLENGSYNCKFHILSNILESSSSTSTLIA